MLTKQVAILFAHHKSYYNFIDICDVYDEKRNAKNFSGHIPVIAHPPCAQWSKLRHFARKDVTSKDYALWSIDIIRKNGGILEHPESSLLFKNHLPLPGYSDRFGFSIQIDQYWFCHRARKRTWLYLCGIEKDNLLPIPFKITNPKFVVSNHKRKSKLQISHLERHLTPFCFAIWLVDAATQVNQK